MSDEIDRKFSDPKIYDNSIDWDDAAAGSEGGYTRHGDYINPAAMEELVALRIDDAELRKENAALLKALEKIQKRTGYPMTVDECAVVRSIAEQAIAKAKGGE